MSDNAPTSTHTQKVPSEPSTVTSAPPAGPHGAGTLAQENAPTHLFTPDGLPPVPGYAVTRELARGGMSVVYAAHDPVLEREVAVKVMFSGHDAARFVVESKVTARLSHPTSRPFTRSATCRTAAPFSP